MRYLPPEVHELIQDTIIALNQNSVGAGIVGTTLLLWASTTVFSILRQSVNRILAGPQSSFGIWLGGANGDIFCH